MRSTAIGVALVLIASSNATAQGTQESPNQPLMFEIAARGYLAGGRAGSLAGDSAVDRLESYVWADQTLCAMGAGDQAPQNVPWTGWHFTGEAHPNLPGEMVIDLHWERVWEKGARVQGGASGQRLYRIRSGERVEIDRIVPASVGQCGTTELKLEAAVMARAAYLMSPGSTLAIGAGGFTTGVRGGRGGVARGVGGAMGSGGAMAAGGTGGDPAGAAVTSAQGGRGRGGARGGVMGGVGSGTTAGATGVGGSVTGVQGGRGGARGGVAAGVAGGVSSTSATTGAVGAGGRGVGRGSVAAGAATGVSGGVGRGAGTPGVMSAGGRGGRGMSDVGAQAAQRLGVYRLMTKNAYDAEVWLVHKKPDGSEVVQQQTVRFGAVKGAFAFPPVQVTGSGGPITVDISGSLQLLNAPGSRLTATGVGTAGARGAKTIQFNRFASDPASTNADATARFVVSIARQARRSTPFIDTRGASDVSIEIPKPNDVLSFELPPLQKATEDLLKGHTFSLRVRVAEIK